MRKTLLTKTAGLLTFLLVSSILFPVLAFAAAGFGSFNYQSSDRSVTTSVYLSQVEYDALTVKDSVYVNVLDATGTPIDVISAVYTKAEGGFYYYDFNFNFIVGGDVYTPVTFEHDGTVSQAAYRPDAAPVFPGGVFIPIVSGTTIQAPTNGEVSASALAQAFAAGKDVTVKITGEFAILPAAALAEAYENGGNSITIQTADSSIVLPLSVFDFDALTEALGVSLADMNIKVTVAKVDADTQSALDAAAEALGGANLTDGTNFNVEAIGDDKAVEVSFGSTYVDRTLTVNKSVDADTTTGVLFNPDTSDLTFVPATFENAGGGAIATLKRNSSSIYSVISLEKDSFLDVPGTHFAKDDIALLSNKLIVAGMSDTEFQPNREITRAEFAALIVRSLALQKDNTNSGFSDVSESAWYAADIAAAVDAGIIYGYPDGTFKPSATISRQELASLVVRAANFAGEAVELTAAEQDQILAPFTDAADLTWSKEELAVAVQSGIVYGMTESLIEPTGTATRGQATAMIKRFLGNVDFIN